MTATELDPTTEETTEATSAPIKRNKRSRKGAIASMSAKATTIAENDVLDLRKVVSNKMNPRKPLPVLQGHGYGLWEKLPDTDKPSLVSLALSANEKERKEFVKLIDQFQEDIKEQAESNKKVSQLQNIIVRFSPGNNDTFDCITGARRIFSKLYAYAAWGDEPTLIARVVEADDTTARLMAFEENFKRRDPDLIETGLMLAEIKRDNGNCGNQQLEVLTGIKWQTCGNLIALATSTKLDDKQRAALRTGEMGKGKALDIIKGKQNPAKPNLNPNSAGNKPGGGRRTAPSLKSFEKAYATGLFQFLDVKENVIEEKKNVKFDCSSDVVHQFLAVLLSIPKKDYKTLAEIKEALEKESK